jgi:hypothetical protein
MNSTEVYKGFVTDQRRMNIRGFKCRNGFNKTKPSERNRYWVREDFGVGLIGIGSVASFSKYYLCTFLVVLEINSKNILILSACLQCLYYGTFTWAILISFRFHLLYELAQLDKTTWAWKIIFHLSIHIRIHIWPSTGQLYYCPRPLREVYGDHKGNTPYIRRC